MRVSAVLLAAGILCVASPARAQTIFSGTYTGGNEFNTTASVSLAYSFVSDDIYMFTLNVTNRGDYGEAYKAIGLFNLPLTFGLVSSSSSLAGWIVDPSKDLNGAGLTKAITAYVAPDPAPTNGLQVGDLVTFNFELSGFTNLDQVMAVGAGIHAISGPSGCSTKLGVIDGAVVGTAPTDGTCVTVSEPAGMMLLFVGLLGLAGFALVRLRYDPVGTSEQAA